ncbi:hypothetical protein J2T37_001214 [Neisseria perflava]|nr:hypothetical protein [Neisseria perflava]
MQNDLGIGQCDEHCRLYYCPVFRYVYCDYGRLG